MAAFAISTPVALGGVGLRAAPRTTRTAPRATAAAAPRPSASLGAKSMMVGSVRIQSAVPVRRAAAARTGLVT
jgi:hypothetical protein